MNFKKLFQDIKPHLLVIIAFFTIGYAYFYKNFDGYTHKEEDVTQGLLKATEIVKYKQIDGAVPGWTNSIFSGMPTTLIYGKENFNKIPLYSYLTPFEGTSYPFKILFLSFIGFYLLMCSFKIKPLFGALAAVAYGFATYSISSVEAAHYTKVLAMALMPALLAALQWLFTGRYLFGGALLAFNLSLQIYYFHYQITFYSIICLLGFGIYYLYEDFKNKRIKNAIIATLISIVAVGVGVLCNYSKISETSHFAENTMRGGNDMSKADPNNKQKETGKAGLDREYAFKWSYSMGETFTLLIPNFYGGSVNEKISETSELATATGGDHGPTYHGGLGGTGNISTSGPIYVGSIIVLLFVLGIIIVKSPIKWVLVALTLVSFILGWGRNFASVNNFLFDSLPYFNKFRTPMMAFCIAQVTMPLLGFLGIKELYDNWHTTKSKTKKVQGEAAGADNNKELWKNVQLAFYIVGGFCLLMAIFGPMIVDVNGPIDNQLKGMYFSNPGQEASWNDFHDALNNERESLLRGDAFRSFIFIGLAFCLLWAWYTNKLTKTIAIAGIGVFAAIDLIGVDWRYLGWDKFVHQKGELSAPAPDPVDQQIMADRDIHYRVFDLTGDPFNNNSGAAFHKMIGGYDPAKLSRYQDLISELIADNKNQDKALDMLNCKYLIGADSSGRKGVIPRPTANGNAWFVQKLTGAKNAKAEMDELKLIDVRSGATFNKEFEGNAGMTDATYQLDSAATTKLLTYHPDTLKYEVNNSNNGYLVFSEIFYDDWKVMIDGKEAKLNKVNYTLRGLAVPAGQHKITCYFNKTTSGSTTDKIELYCSLAILGLLLLNAGLWLKGYFGKTA
ncbi:MAG: YfhO family protein [Bacteroidota bacterium]